MMGTSPYPPLPIPATQSFSATTDVHTHTTETSYYIYILHRQIHLHILLKLHTTFLYYIHMILKHQKFHCKRMQNLQEKHSVLEPVGTTTALTVCCSLGSYSSCFHCMLSALMSLISTFVLNKVYLH